VEEGQAVEEVLDDDSGCGVVFGGGDCETAYANPMVKLMLVGDLGQM